MIQLPPSKSIGARYLVATFFGGTLPADPLFEDNEDLMVLQEALLEVYSDEEPIDYGDSPIDVGASGTALRFLTAVCASSPGADYVITGSPRLMERPMEALLTVLREAGAGIQCMGENNSGPYRVTGNKLQGGTFFIPGDISSQFISALMLVAPYWEKGIKLFFTTELVSRPYIEMTGRVMEKFGIQVKLTDTFVEVSPGEYKVKDNFNVEADWSSASFFYEAVALGAGEIEIENLPAPEISLQGDSRCALLFNRIGVNSVFAEDVAKLSDTPLPVDFSSIEENLMDCPDLVLPLAVGCLCKGIKFQFSSVGHLRLKESDRIESLQKEALKLGFVIKSSEDEISWDGELATPEENPIIETYSDHRVAMSFAIAAFKFGEIKIKNPEVVEKSFIDFWNQIAKLGLTCHQDNNIMTVKK